MTRLVHNDFPFTAVAGQERLKLALILCAINPKIGGVLISGPRGSAKSTLARGLVHIMPALVDVDEQVPFATLPLGTSEDRLLGALDLQQVLQDKQVAFKEGLLSKAHGGVLYVDEVNLLADHLVDQLLDVSASGVNRVERDGVSHEHDSRFLLVGTMNPDEGELRPQLQDRFGLLVELSNTYGLEERIQIVRLREEFDQDPSAFIEAFKYKQRNLKNSILAARLALRDVRCSDECRMDIARRCHMAEVDGVRGDIVWVRSAIAHAAWHGRKQVAADDILAVEEFVLAHRRQHKSQPPQNSASRKPTPSFLPDTQPTNSSSSHEKSNESSGGEGEWGAMKPQKQAATAPINLETANVSPDQNSTASIVKEVSPGKLQGKSKGGTRANEANKGSDVDWFRSFVREPQAWPPSQLINKAEKTGQSSLHLILLDTSASTLKQGGFAKAKGVILDIANRAYLAREQISVLGFGQDNVSSILSKVRAPKEIANLINDLEAGGGTPFRVAIQNASRLLDKEHISQPDLVCYTYILTDGRTQADVSDISLRGNVVLIDIENAPIKRGRGISLAEQLSAQYVAVDATPEVSL
ncbi:ATP-binding protein [Marinomonas sp. C2222]|uniref:ATP-binding protein n=1 Tax=Marinomonas sargassi TaxID=2984494 RepID=A0ABT2YN75_9GAMM|nr:ATP-binding protein [Marinomonas sargassi]MCV2401334.1 ATP-binding protein [Marinomonas sargassi]